MADIQVANTDADLSGNTVVTEENAYTITGLHTFSRSTNAPFACISGAAYVQYLDADKLDGQEGTYYLAAANFTGTLAVNQGGTGATSLTDGGVLLGSGTGAVTAMAVLADGEMIVGDGSTDPVAESGADLRTSIGVGTGDSPTFTAVTVGQVDITAEGDLRLQDNTGGQYVGFDAPATVSGSYTLTLPAAIGAVDQVLSINNTDGTLQWATPDSGDITSVVAGAGMTGGGTAGDVTLNVIGTADKITVNANDVTIASTYVGQTSITTLGTVATGVWNGTAVAAAYGGTGQTSYTTGDLPYASGSTAISKLGIGTANKVLTSSGSAPQWSTQVVNAALPTNIDVGGTLDVTSATTLDSTLGVVGAVTFNDAGADVDFRVESDDNANMLFVDGGEDRVGIGTGTPQGVLDVTIAGEAKTDTGGVYGYLGKSNEASNYAALQLFAMGGASAADRKWKFQTIEAGVANSGSMVFQQSGGYVGIGTDSPAGLLDAGKDTDRACYFGKGYISSTGTDMTADRAYFGHVDCEHAHNFAMYQTADGNTTINAMSGQSIWFSIPGNVAVGNWNATGLRIGDATGASYKLDVNGSLNKTSGTFSIDHPLPSMTDTHKLVHSFVEGPRADLIYRGSAVLDAGTAEVDLDEAAGMTSGTWVLLCRDEQCYTTNETGWHHVRGSVSGSTLTIDCEEVCNDTVSWMVVACRKDQHMYDTDTLWTDDDGYPIIEPLKPLPNPDPPL